MKRVWVFTATSFVDDHKMRGQSPSTNEVLALFSTLERAERYKHYWLDDFVRTFHERNIDADADTYADYETPDGKLRHDLDDHDLERLADQFSEGEFVPRTMEWELKEVTVDLMSTPVLEPPQPSEEDQEGEGEGEEAPLKRARSE